MTTPTVTPTPVTPLPVTPMTITAEFSVAGIMAAKQLVRAQNEALRQGQSSHFALTTAMKHLQNTQGIHEISSMLAVYAAMGNPTLAFGIVATQVANTTHMAGAVAMQFAQAKDISQPLARWAAALQAVPEAEQTLSRIIDPILNAGPVRETPIATRIEKLITVLTDIARPIPRIDMMPGTKPAY